MYVQTALFAPSRAITFIGASVNKAVHMYDSFGQIQRVKARP